MSKISYQNENSDFISHLPAPIIHYIFSLFNNKECARTCVLSKTWKNMYYSKPNMLFHEQDFIPSNSFINSLEGRNLLLNYVDQSLNRAIEMKSNHLERFELHLTLCDPDGIPQSSNTVKQLLKKVFGLSVKTMSLMLDSVDKLSHFILESKTLIEVHFDCFFLIKACKTINFPNLRVLSLFHIDLQNEALRMLISGCPCIELFRLSHCSTSQNLQLLGLTKLVEITVSFCRDVKTVEIKSLYFQNLYVVDDCDESSTITLLGCETMSNLHLNVWLFNNFSEFKWLVELKLMNLVIKGRISSQSIKRLIIKHCKAETDIVQIRCQNLLSLEYEANAMPFHFDGLCEVRDLNYGFSLLQNGRCDQINALENLFGSTFNFMKNLKMVILFGPLKEVIILDGLIEVMLSILKKMSNLLKATIFITTHSIDWNAIVVDSYPTATSLAVNVVSLWGSNFSKDVREKLLRLKESHTWKNVNVCFVQKGFKNKNIPIELESYQGSKYQMSRITLELDWSK